MAKQETGFVQDTMTDPTSPPASKDVYQDDLLEDMPLELLRRVDAEHDMHRIRSATALINTFNYAIQVQANRDQWLPSDYHRFVRALLALDSIGSDAVQIAKSSRLESDIRQTLAEQARSELKREVIPEDQEAIAERDQVQAAQLARDQYAPPNKRKPVDALPRSNSVRGDPGNVIRDDLRLPR